MNFLIALFFVFCIQFSVRAADTTPATETILVKVGDIVQLPLNAEPIEVEAKINGLWHTCTLMPGDSFEVVDIINYRDGIESIVKFQKREGTPGNHEICFADSSIDVMGTHEVEKSKNGIPQIMNKILFPFFIDLRQLEDIQRRKRLPTTLSTVETETVLFKVGDIIEYPLDAEPIEVESSMDQLDFKCTEAPGDSFEVTRILNLSKGENIIIFRKREGMPGNQDICPRKSFTAIEIAQCVLKRSEEGMPEGLLCNHSIKTFFNPHEENNE